MTTFFAYCTLDSFFPLALSTAWGQSFSGKIVGLVTDSSAAVIATRCSDRSERGNRSAAPPDHRSAGIYVARGIAGRLLHGAV